MTIEQFNNTRWGAGIKVLCKPMNMDCEAEVHTVNSVNLDQALIATNDHKYEMETNQWHRCENCEIINSEKEELYAKLYGTKRLTLESIFPEIAKEVEE